MGKSLNKTDIFFLIELLSVAARSKAWVCGPLLACLDCGFEYRRRHGCLSLVSVVCCQVEVSASG
jgi:hypothetical protein